MTKSELNAAVSRIERAPNMSRIIDAYDAAVGGSDVSAHRYEGRWQVWHGEYAGFCGDFSEVRTHLANAAEETLEREAEKAEARKPAMVAQPVQRAQACAIPAAVFAARAKVAAIKAEGCNIIDDVRVRRVEAEAARRAWMDCLNQGKPSHDAQARYAEAARLVETTLKALWDRGESLRLAEMEERRASMVPQPVQQAQACGGRPGPVAETASPVRLDHVAAILDELVREDADAAEIAAINAVGPLGGGKVLAPGRDGIDVFDDGDASKPYTTLPRGLPPRTARLLIDYWERGYERGLKNGAAEIQRGMKRLLGVAVL